ncbi:DUF2442 domain-containing protein [Spirosoma luteum]|uniref:DUF2442 domain-containing protein n=1 Tax=Spirosoma luteum TaxID=431553 RepID=UPI000361412B|nr:DUF2442 domain-containing protein [Spirosoma luteum]
MNEVKEIETLNDYRIWIKFQDGLEKVINFRPFLGKGFTAELLQEGKFNEVSIEEGGGLAWPNGYDFCPNYLHDYVEGEVLAKA